MIDYDKLGHCAMCHKKIGDFPFPERPYLIKWNPEKREVNFRLTNGSILHTAMCEKCSNNVTEENFSAVMHSVIRGWEEELKYSTMSDKEKTEYVKNFFGLKIEGRV